MTATINASTSSGVVITPDNSGNILLQYNGVAAPAFSAYLNTNQSIPTGVDTKVQFNTEVFDTASCYDTSTYRFTPTVAGYYQVTVSVRDWTGASAGTIRANIWKNGSVIATSIVLNNVNGMTSMTTNLVYMNGSTDYLEGYMFQNSGSSMNCHGLQQYTFFQACLLRGA